MDLKLLNMMQSPSDALQWEMKFSKIQNSSQCLTDVKMSLKGKNIALFGSYGWGDGEWMRNWEESCKEAGANLVCDSVICQEEPDDEATEACKALGAALV